MLNLTKVTEDLKRGLDSETEQALQKISQMQGFIAGIGRAREMIDKYVEAEIKLAEQAAAKKMAEALAEKKEAAQNATNED